MKAFPLFLWLLMFPLTLVFAQMDEEEEVEDQAMRTNISLTEMVSMIRSGGDEIFLQDLLITLSKDDDRFLVDKIFFKVYEIPAPSDKPLSLYLYNCSIDLGGSNAISFRNWNFNRLNIIGLQTRTPVTFDECSQTGAYPIRFENCIFNHALRFSGEDNRLKQLRIEKCTFVNQLIINQKITEFRLINSYFAADSNWFSNLDQEQTFYQLDLHNTHIESLELFRVEFDRQLPENLYSINLGGAVIGKLFLQFIRAHTLNFTDASIEKSFLADSLDICGYVAVQNFDFPAENTNLPWHNFSNEKLCVFISEGTDKHLPYQPKSTEAVSRTLFFNELMACYKKFNDMYETRGDKISANACYIEIKDLQTRQQKQLYETTGEINYLIVYYLNRIAKHLSDYATNPARSIFVIQWIILLFALFYMFTFSEWDGINFRYFLRQYEILTEYFMSDKSLRELYCHNQEEQSEQFESLRSANHSRRASLPAAIRFMGAPLYGAWKFRHRLTLWIYDKLEFLHGSWLQIPARRKVTASIGIGFLLVLYFVFVVLVKFINSYILSMNLLVSLGFGKTPEQIIPLYISIIQGVVGWFVLTFFSITLLSQMVQNF
jgi:hypothetical protein